MKIETKHDPVSSHRLLGGVIFLLFFVLSYMNYSNTGNFPCQREKGRTELHLYTVAVS
jgi:hypothetical protein